MTPEPTEAPTFDEWLARYRELERAAAEHLMTFGKVRDVRPNHFYHKTGDQTGFFLNRKGGVAEITYAPNGVPSR